MSLNPLMSGPAVFRFFNREDELSLLESAWASNRAELVTLWGRRRVGKSELLGRFANSKRGIYLYGTRTAEANILADLTRQLADIFGETFLLGQPFASWDVALDFLQSRVGGERLLIVFDEFPFLCDVTPGLDTLVQRWWDRVHQTGNVMVVVAGSAFSFMADLTGARGALHGRRTWSLDVSPFDYYDAANFYSHLSAVDRVRAYACFGGIPAYLRFWDASMSLANAVQQTFLTPGHFLYREGEELPRTEFHDETLYVSILRAIAHGERRPSDIARASGKNSANDISTHLDRLRELRLVMREVPITDWERGRVSRSLYRVADPYFRFWYRYVAPAQSLIQRRGATEVWENAIGPTLEEFVARTTWEDVCNQYLWRLVASGRISTQLTQLGRWWDGKDEIDLVGLAYGDVALVGECKWTNAPVGIEVFDNLRRKALKLPADTPLWVLASRSGFTPAIRERAKHGDLLLIEPDDLFPESWDAARAPG